MEAYLQKNVPRKQTKQKVPNLKKNPILKQDSSNVKIKNLDFEKRNVKSIVDLNKHKSNVKSNHFSSPMFLEAFADCNINDDFSDDAKIDYGKLPRAKEILNLQSPRRRKLKNKTTKANTTKRIPQNTANDDEKGCINWRLIDDVNELLTPEGSFQEQKRKPKIKKRRTKITKTAQESTDDEKYSEGDLSSEHIDMIENWLAQIAKTQGSIGGDTNSNLSSTADEVTSDFDPDLTTDIIKNYYQPGKKSRVFNPQEIYIAKVPKPCNTLENLCTKCKFLSLNAPRNNKPLAVIDLDIAIYYFKPNQTNYEKPTPRPFLHNFFSSLYTHYDLAIWVKTPMKMLLDKLNSLEIITEKHAYKICFCLDNSSIVNSYIPRLGNPTVKPLEVIWNFYTQYNEKNVILIGDQRHKFYYNKKFALQVKKCQQVSFTQDLELLELTEYLKNIAKSCKDFSKVGVRITNTYFMAKK